MFIIPVFAGLDYYQNQIQTCVIDGQGNLLVNPGPENDSNKIWQLRRRHEIPGTGRNRLLF
jgi:hypothetical protein